MNTALRKRALEAKFPVDEQAPVYLLPSAEEFAAKARHRIVLFMLGGGLLAGLVTASFVAYGLDNILLPIVLLLAIVTPILLWRFPRMSLYVTVAAACLFEMFQTSYADALTDRVPFFWNINTIFLTYAHINLKAVPLNLVEVFLLIAGVCSGIRSVYTGTVNLRGGALLLPILVYVGFVLLGWVNGLLTGGDFKISLQEVRAQFYFLVIYLMAVNFIRDRRQLNSLLWVVVLCIGLKGILYTFRRYVTLAGLPLSDQGVGSHEEAFFFDCFIVLLMVLLLCRVYKRLQWVMWALLPFVVLGNVACNRRAGTAALAVVLPLLLLAAYRALPERRRLIMGLCVTLTVGLSIYYPLFKNSSSILAQPARAIKSNFQPDTRDAGSNAARDAENANLMATIRSAPLLGNGYGHRYLHVVYMADISDIYELEDYLPHNTVLWVWERLGIFGFLAFWMMVAAILVLAGQTARLENADATTKAIGIFTLCVMCMLIVFGLLDLQLSSYRDVLFAGGWVGVLAIAPSLNPRPVSTRSPVRVGQ